MTTSLGRTISVARLAKDQSLRQLGAQVNLSASYLNDIEHDRRVPSAANIVAIADFLGLNRDELMAVAGRVGSDAEEYLRVEPAAGVLLRTAASSGMSNEELRELIKSAHHIIGKRTAHV